MAADNDYHDGLCQNCGVYQNLKAFRRTNGCRIRVCRRCELMQCIACTAKVPQTCFTATEISNYFTKATAVVCLQCKRRGCTPRTPHPVLHGCSGPCGKILGRASYTSRAWSRKAEDKNYSIVCTICKKNEAARKHARLRLRLKREHICKQHETAHKQPRLNMEAHEWARTRQKERKQKEQAQQDGGYSTSSSNCQ